jgi:chromosomal replication initiation ATPase DnaA
MQDSAEIEHFFSNIQKGLKMYSLKEFNSAIKDIINTKGDNKKDDIKYTLNLVCTHYNISIQSLMGKDNRGIIVDAKQVAYCLLYFDLKISVKSISKNIFYNWRNSVYRGINRLKTINTNIKEDEIFSNNYKAIREKLILYKSNNTK